MKNRPGSVPFWWIFHCCNCNILFTRFRFLKREKVWLVTFSTHLLVVLNLSTLLYVIANLLNIQRTEHVVQDLTLYIQWGGAGIACKIHAICSPGHLHRVLGEIDDPVDQVEGAERKGEEDAGVFVDDAGASQDVVGRYGWALLQEGLGVNRWVGKCFCRAVKQRGRVHPLLQHTARIHLENKRKDIESVRGNSH